MLYVRKIDLKNRNDSNVLLYEMTEAGSRVLDVGCACGDLSALLAERKNCRCVGLEADREGVEACRKRRVFDEVLQIDLNNFAAADYPRFRQSFDVVVCGDVLEHLRQPAAVLSELKLLLKPGGYFLVSLPNAAHASIKAGLLQSHVFQYVFNAAPAAGRLRQENLKVLLPCECGRISGGFMFKIKRFLLLKIPGMIRYIQKIRSR